MGQIRHEIGSLTGIRGAAACWVVLYHLHEFDGWRGAGGTLLRHGYLAVDLFFVLSGFVMALSYERLFAVARFRPSAYAAFLIRRLARIYPLYIALTLLAAAIGILPHLARGQWPHDVTRPLVANVLLIQTWGVSYPLDGPSWSISTEFGAYILFPLLMAAMVFRARWVAVLGTLSCFAVVAVATMQAKPPSYPFARQGPLDIAWDHSPWPLIRCVAEFSLGLVAYRVGRAGPRALRTPGVASLVLVVLLGLLLVPGTDLAILALLPLLLIGLLAPADPVSRVFASAPLHALGRWSYAIYLWHGMLAPHAFDRFRNGAARLIGVGPGHVAGEAAFWLLLLVVAALSYDLIERPGQNALRAVERRLFRAEDARIGATALAAR